MPESPNSSKSKKTQQQTTPNSNSVYNSNLTNNNNNNNPFGGLGGGIGGHQPQNLIANLAQRIKFLKQNLAQAPMPSITSKRRQLCSIEEAWNLPISLEMNSRQQQQQTNRQFNKNGCNQVSFTYYFNLDFSYFQVFFVRLSVSFALAFCDKVLSGLLQTSRVMKRRLLLPNKFCVFFFSYPLKM